MPKRERRRTEGGITQNLVINLNGMINISTLAMSDNEEIVANNVGDDVGLVEEELEQRNGVGVTLRAVHGGDDGVAGEDSGAGFREDGLPGEEGGGVEVEGADEGLDAVVEVQAGAGQGPGIVGGPGGVGGGWWPWGGRRMVPEGVEWGFDAEAAFATAPFGCGFFGGGESEGAVVEEGEWWGWSGEWTEGAEEEAGNRHGCEREKGGIAIGGKC